MASPDLAHIVSAKPWPIALWGGRWWLILLVFLGAACTSDPYALTGRTLELARARRPTIMVRQDDTPRGLALFWRAANGTDEATPTVDAGGDAREGIWLLPLGRDSRPCSSARIAAYSSPDVSTTLTPGEDQPLAADDFVSFYANLDEELPCEFAVLYRDLGGRGAFLELYGPGGLLEAEQITPETYPAAWILVPVVALLETGVYIAYITLGTLGAAMG